MHMLSLFMLKLSFCRLFSTHFRDLSNIGRHAFSSVSLDNNDFISALSFVSSVSFFLVLTTTCEVLGVGEIFPC